MDGTLINSLKQSQNAQMAATNAILVEAFSISPPQTTAKPANYHNAS
jgi:hypothetical protein